MRLIIALAACWLAVSARLCAQQQPAWELEALKDDSSIIYDFQTGLATATNGVLVRYSGAVLRADRITLDEVSGEVIADGEVRVQRDEQVWVSEHLSYNFKTRQMRAEQFRTGKAPVFAAGQGLRADVSNQVYTATDSLITTEDISDPLITVRAKSITIIPGDRILAKHAWLEIGGVPVFYFPYYSRSLTEPGNEFRVVPGYRSRYGAFLLNSYTWQIDKNLEAIAHFDYRTRRGFAGGPDLNYDYGKWGEGTARYYYLYDLDPNQDNNDQNFSNNRQRVWFSYQANPATNLTLQSLVRYQTDVDVVHDFFPGEYRENPQPSTYFEGNKAWRNLSLDLYVQPRVNDFLQTVERLPDVRLSGFRQRVGPTPVFYESETSAGYYRQLFPETNGIPYGQEYEAGRVDTWHQLLLPYTAFGWLNLTPRVGGRFTYYSHASGPGATTEAVDRWVFNTGAEVSFKASRLWADTRSKWLDLDGLRHIVQPSVNYVFVPNPSASPSQLPQFDPELASLRILPIDFPDFNSIDSIDSQNVLRLGLNNKLQTKRTKEVAEFLDWNMFIDWRLDPSSGQQDFSDFSSDFALRPRKWLLLESITRFNFEDAVFRLAFNSATISPNDVWAWTVGHYYLRDDFGPVPDGWGPGDNVFLNSILFRFNHNWAIRATQHYDILDGRMQEQSYTVYRDMRSWTGALSVRLQKNDNGQNDFTIAFTFSLKSFPRYSVGEDVLRPYNLLEN